MAAWRFISSQLTAAPSRSREQQPRSASSRTERCVPAQTPVRLKELQYGVQPRQRPRLHSWNDSGPSGPARLVAKLKQLSGYVDDTEERDRRPPRCPHLQRPHFALGFLSTTEPLPLDNQIGFSRSSMQVFQLHQSKTDPVFFL